MAHVSELHRSWTASARYLIAVLVFLVALGLRFLIAPQTEGLAFVTFYPAILISFFVCDTGPGILDAVLSGLAGEYFFRPPYSAFSTAWSGYLSLSFYLLTAALIGWIISRLHNNARQLRGSEMRYRALAEATFEGIAITQEGRLVEANDRLLQMLGMSRDELLGQKVEQFLPPEDTERVMANIRSGSESLIEHDLLRKDRSHITVEAHGRTLFDWDPPLRLTAMRDITRKKQTMQALAQESEKNRILLRNASDGIHILDPEGYVLEASDSFCDMLGYTRAEVIGMNVAQWDTHFDPDELKGIVKRQISERGRHLFETRHRRKDGSEFDVEVSGYGLMLDGRPVLFNASRDITERRRYEEQLARSELELKTIFDTEPECVKLLAEDGTLLRMNQAGLQMIDADSADQVVGLKVQGIVVPRCREAFTALTRRVFQGESGTLEFEIVGLKGGHRWLETHAVPLRDPQGNITALLGVTRDITAHKKADEALRIAAIAFESQEGMMVTDADKRILNVNKAFTALTGYQPEEVVGKTPAVLRSGRHGSEFYRSMWESLDDTGSWQGEVWNRRKDGDAYPEWLVITAVKGEDEAITHYVGAFTDLTERKDAEKQILTLAFYDALTHLPNRRLLIDRLDQALAASQRSGHHGALIYLDLDQFKSLNDSQGHTVGDQLLVEVASRLRSCVREGDTVARLGGDEFVVMLEDLADTANEAASQAEHISQKILASLNQPYRLDHLEHHGSASIGVTLFRDRVDAVDDLLKRADLAMYQAKAAGRNTIRFFDPTMQSAVEARASLEAELRNGLKNNEFTLYYQPQVDATGQVVAVEALARWQHPERGLISPLEFIALAEETGLIVSLGHQVLQQASEQLKTWSMQPATANLSISVNVSPRQFHHKDFVDMVLGAVQASQAQPDRLVLEITEGLLLDKREENVAKLHALRSEGIRFSVDDFGTGYSSLAYLKRLPLDELKIDRVFVADIEQDENAAAICAAFIQLAHILGLRVVAEGVETEAQRYFLSSQHHCDVMQGYLFGRPMPASELTSFLN